MSWPEMHGAVTHFPVALLITAFFYDAGAMFLHRPAWRVWATILRARVRASPR